MANGRTNNSNFTMDDIASELGLSKSTVSRALAGSDRISSETKERVNECARKHGFRPNLVARALAGQKTLNIAVVLPFEANAAQMLFFHECLSGIVARAAKDAYSVLVCMTDNEAAEILESVLENKKADSVVLTQLRHNDKNISLLKKYSTPFVVIGSGAGDDVIQVDSRMKENCREFTKVCSENLPSAGKVLFVCGSLDVEANNNRLSGFLSAMEELSSSGRDMKYAVCTDSSDIDGQFDLSEWNLILCSDDVVCAGVLDILKEERIKIGKDGVMLASFHDSVLLKSNTPGISALNVSAGALGKRACEIALGLSGRPSSVPCETMNYVECTFEMRESTGGGK